MARTKERLTTRNPLAVDPEREHRVRERAYLMWEADGRPHGRDVEYWERARELVALEESAGSVVSPVPRTASESPPETPVRATVPEKPVLRAKPVIPAKLVEPPIGLTDKAEQKETPAPKRKSRAKPKKPA